MLIRRPIRACFLSDHHLLTDIDPTPNPSAPTYPLPTLFHTHQTSILAPTVSTHLHHPHSDFEIEVVDISTQHLRPPALRAGLGIFALDITSGERIHADCIAHARKFGAKGRVRLDGVGMLEGEVVKQRLEDRQLGLERVEVSGAEGSTVGCVGFGERVAVLEGRESDATTAGHFRVDLSCVAS